MVRVMGREESKVLEDESGASARDCGVVRVQVRETESDASVRE